MGPGLSFDRDEKLAPPSIRNSRPDPHGVDEGFLNDVGGGEPMSQAVVESQLDDPAQPGLVGNEQFGPGGGVARRRPTKPGKIPFWKGSIARVVHRESRLRAPHLRRQEKIKKPASVVLEVPSATF